VLRREQDRVDALGPEPPTLAEQLRSTTAVTLAVVVVMAVLGGLAMKYSEAISVAWARVFGDRTMSLADGVTLDSAPASVPVLTASSRTFGLPGDTSRLVAAFGGPVTRVTTVTTQEAEGLGPARIEGTTAGTYVEFARFRTPYGLVSLPVEGTSVEPVSSSGFEVMRLAGDGRGPVAADATARAATVRRVIGSFGWTAGAAKDLIDLRITEVAGDGTSVGATVRAAPRVRQSCAECAVPWPISQFVFDPAGHLRWMYLWLDTIDSVTSTPGRSAAEAWDAARHHVDGLLTSSSPRPVGGPVVTARLVPSYPYAELPVGGVWEFYDVGHVLVASVPALP
jgi:hypothetical protein